MIKELFEELKKRNLRLSAAESLTGGLFSASITSVPGASSVFVGANVTYANDAKEALGVKQETLDKYGAVSQETAKEMAISVGDYHKTDVSVSFSGNAGPDAMEGKPVGEVYIGIKIKVNINDLEHICRENNIPLCFAYSRLAYEGIISYGSKEYNEHKEKIN